MTKTIEPASEVVREAKPLFGKAARHTRKDLRQRYERRKARESLTLTDWLFGRSTASNEG